MTNEEKRIVWNHIVADPYATVKELYNDLIEYVDVSISTVRKYRRIILKRIEENGDLK